MKRLIPAKNQEETLRLLKTNKKMISFKVSLEAHLIKQRTKVNLLRDKAQSKGSLGLAEWILYEFKTN